ncbi:MAG: hypothetical protein Q4D31_00900 [Eubacteriales bacterium]|nr:hypothetical protein [Eubacteriales bacterium]
MDAKLQSFMEKVKGVADKTGQAAGCAADAAGKKATELTASTRLNLQIFDLNTECDVLYKEMGRLVYELHRGAEVSNSELEEKIAAVDEKQQKIAALREELAGMRAETVCPHCGKPCGHGAAFCAACGGAL